MATVKPFLVILFYIGFATAFVVENQIDDGKKQVPLSEVQCYDMVRLATAGDRLDLVRLLVDQGCGVNRPNGTSGREPTPLHISVINNSIQMVGLLLDYGADVNARANINKELDVKKMATCKYMLEE